jgi:hypothetical protein
MGTHGDTWETGQMVPENRHRLVIVLFCSRWSSLRQSERYDCNCVT